jgi:hypothetical protein
LFIEAVAKPIGTFPNDFTGFFCRVVPFNGLDVIGSNDITIKKGCFCKRFAFLIEQNLRVTDEWKKKEDAKSDFHP